MRIELQDDVQDLVSLGVFAPARERFGVLSVVDRLGVVLGQLDRPPEEDLGLRPALLLFQQPRRVDLANFADLEAGRVRRDGEHELLGGVGVPQHA